MKQFVAPRLQSAAWVATVHPVGQAAESIAYWHAWLVQTAVTHVPCGDGRSAVQSLSPLQLLRANGWFSTSRSPPPQLAANSAATRNGVERSIEPPARRLHYHTTTRHRVCA